MLEQQKVQKLKLVNDAGGPTVGTRCVKGRPVTAHVPGHWMERAWLYVPIDKIQCVAVFDNLADFMASVQRIRNTKDGPPFNCP